MDTIYNRPLFRQMGGTAMPSPQEQMAMQQPMPMPQPMMSPEQIGEQMAQVESDAGAMGVGIGQELVNRMMQGLDSAETPKDLMDSIRGNDRSVEERRTELAEFVGEEDAEQTPETVLAMVQPTIMLTERGAMDSGVGELMEGVADVDMETMEGEPTDVGGGVASLMGVGQPPVQNFRNGGIVQKFKDGTEANFADYVTQGAQIAESLYPSQDDYFKKMALLNLSNLGVTTGLGLASGRSPSGQPLGGNVVSKVAQIGTEIFPEITKSAMSLAQAKQAQEQARRQQALQIGTSLYQASKPEYKIVNNRLVRINSDGTTDVVQDFGPEFKAGKVQDFQYTGEDGEKKIISLNLSDEKDIETLGKLKTKYEGTFRKLKDPSKDSYKTAQLEFMSNPDTARSFFEGTLNKGDAIKVFYYLNEYVQNPPIIGYNESDQPIYGKPTFPYPYNQYIKDGSLKEIEKIIAEKYPVAVPVTPSVDSSVPTGQEDKTIVKPDDDSVKPSSMEESLKQDVSEDVLIDTLIKDFKGIYEGNVDLTTGSGIGDVGTALSDELISFAKESKTLGKKFDLSERPNVQTVLNGMFGLAKLILRDDIAGRPLAADAEQLEKLFKEPGVFTRDATFYKQLKNQRLRIAFGLDVAQRVFEDDNTSSTDKKIARKRINQLTNLYNMYTPFIDAYENLIQGPGGDELFSKDDDELEEIPPNFKLGDPNVKITPLQ